MKPDKPIVYNEFYLDVMTGGSSELPAPVTSEQHYLAHLAGLTVTLPQPVILRDMFLAKICGMDVDVPTYIPGQFPRKFAYYAKAAGQDVDVPQPITREEMYWFDYVSRQPSEKEYTGAVPVIFTANGQPLIGYLISGNTVQSGTPTPDSPVDVQGVGTLDNGQYKIPISSAGQTNNIYLGEVETTRKIRKYEFTGQETISQGSENYYTSLPTPGVPYSNMYCTHNVDGACSVNNNGGYIWFKISSWSDYATAGDLKAFFQQEYAAGTPVTVWYVLATEEIAVVNEPLMKIGDYADTVSMEQASVEIPTAKGTNTLDVLTDVKPSEVYIKYKE